MCEDKSFPLFIIVERTSVKQNNFVSSFYTRVYKLIKDKMNMVKEKKLKIIIISLCKLILILIFIIYYKLLKFFLIVYHSKNIIICYKYILHDG